jgi:hypothetical protein
MTAATWSTLPRQVLEAQACFYAGNVASWKLFANSQKLKMAMTLADVNAAKSKTETEAASSAGVFTSNDKNVKPSGATRLLPKFSAM